MDRSSPGVRGRMNSTGSLAPLPDFSPQLPNNAMLPSNDAPETVRRAERNEEAVVEPSMMAMADMEMDPVERVERVRGIEGSLDSESEENSQISCKTRSVCSNFD